VNQPMPQTFTELLANICFHVFNPIK